MDTRLAPEKAQHEELFDRLSSRLNTCMPGIVKDFDPATQTCTVTPAIQMRTYQDGISGLEQLGDIQHVPLYFPFTPVAGFALTLPVRPGDSCLLIFAQRCIDDWWELGGVQPPGAGLVGARHHNLSDAFALCCGPSLPDVLGSWFADGIELRNRERNSRVTVEDAQVTTRTGETSEVVNANGTIVITSPDSTTVLAGPTTVVINADGTVTITAPTGVTVDAPLSAFTGNVAVAGGITCSGTYGDSGGTIQTPGNVIDGVRSMAADRAIYNGHTHSDPQGGAVSVPGALQ
jgi:hypothetical protein